MNQDQKKEHKTFINLKEYFSEITKAFQNYITTKLNDLIDIRKNIILDIISKQSIKKIIRFKEDILDYFINNEMKIFYKMDDILSNISNFEFNNIFENISKFF